MTMRMRAGIGLIGFAVLAGCGSGSTSVDVGTTHSSTSSAALASGVHFGNATLAWDRSAPINPGGPMMKVSGTLVSGAGAGVDVGVIKAYVLDGGPGRANYPVASISVHGSAFAQTFGVIGPGGNEIRLDYVVDGTVMASTVVTD